MKPPKNRAAFFFRNHGSQELVGAAGIEPATTGLENRCSIRLSYAPAFTINSLQQLKEMMAAS
jgi:hypothetical protein